VKEALFLTRLTKSHHDVGFALGTDVGIPMMSTGDGLAIDKQETASSA